MRGFEIGFCGMGVVLLAVMIVNMIQSRRQHYRLQASNTVIKILFASNDDLAIRLNEEMFKWNWPQHPSPQFLEAFLSRRIEHGPDGTAIPVGTNFSRRVTVNFGTTVASFTAAMNNTVRAMRRVSRQIRKRPANLIVPEYNVSNG